MKRALFLCILAMCAWSFVSAQKLSLIEPKATHCEIWGRVVATPGLLGPGIKIELVSRDESIHQVAETRDGSFEFRAVPPGPYQFRISDRRGNPVLQGSRVLAGSRDEVIFHVPMGIPPAKWMQTVSLRELGHKVPKDAMKAFQQGVKALGSGDVTHGIAQLEQAITLDPDFAEAQATLAGELMMLNNVNQGLMHAQLAFKANPRLMEAAHMFAVALIQAKQYREAEEVVSSALANRVASSNAEFYTLLAVSLLGQRKNTGEALEDVELAAIEYPSSRLLIANILTDTGQIALAIDQVRKYVSTAASNCERQELQAWITKATRAAEGIGALPVNY